MEVYVFDTFHFVTVEQERCRLGLVGHLRSVKFVVLCFFIVFFKIKFVDDAVGCSIAEVLGTDVVDEGQFFDVLRSDGIFFNVDVSDGVVNGSRLSTIYNHQIFAVRGWWPRGTGPLPYQGLETRFSGYVPKLFCLAETGIQAVNDGIKGIRCLVLEVGHAVGARISTSSEGGPLCWGNGRHCT